jgi:hypothetical protein
MRPKIRGAGPRPVISEPPGVRFALIAAALAFLACSAAAARRRLR